MGQFEDMEAFVGIVDAGGIGRAAEQVGLTKSAVSRRLSELEASLGTQLLMRTTRRISLTDAGERYYVRARQIISDVGELNAATTRADRRLDGAMKVAVPLSFGLLHLSPAIIDFARAHPDLTVNLTFEDRRVDMIEEGIDLAVRIADMKDSSLIARKLAPIRRVLCASPAYLDRRGHPRTAEDLKDHAVLHYTNAPGSTWHLLDPGGRPVQVRPSVRMAANNGDFLLDAARAGLGITMLPTFVAWRALDAGDLVHVLADYTYPELNAYAVYPQTRFVSARVRAFIDFLVNRFGAEPYWDATPRPD